MIYCKLGDLLNFFHTLHIGRLLKHFLCITDREAFVAFFDALKIGKLSKHFKVKHTQKIRRLLPTNCLSVFEKPANCLSVFEKPANCLSVFEHFDGLVLKGIIFSAPLQTFVKHLAPNCFCNGSWKKDSVRNYLSGPQLENKAWFPLWFNMR